MVREREMIPAVSKSVTSTPENESHHCLRSTRCNPADSDRVPGGLVFGRPIFRRSMSVILEFDRSERCVIVQDVLSMATIYPVGSPFEILGCIPDARAQNSLEKIS
jgi:hypothetical protein